MEFLQTLDWGTLLPLILICGVILGILVIVLVVFQILGGVIGAIGGIFQFFMGILTGGPIAWCGCLVLIGGCGFCGLLSIALIRTIQSCDTNYTNFCRILGY